LIRSYHRDLRLFCEYAADPRYEWTAVCERLYGTHPAQVCLECEPGRRALAKRELQELSGYAARRHAPTSNLGGHGYPSAGGHQKLH
jgi:hypothetical protein